MAENCGIADIIENAKRGDEKRASYVYLMEKYKSQKIKFKDEEEEKTSAAGFTIRFRLSQAYKSLEEQEIQASIPNLKPRRRRRIRMSTVTPPQRMTSIAENHETDNDKTSESPFKESVNSSLESPPTTRTVTSTTSAVDRFRNAARRVSMVRAWAKKLPNGDEKDGEGQKETQAVNHSVVRFKSEEDPPRPASSRTPRTPKKILVKGDRTNKREKETARLIAAIQCEKAKAKEAKYNKAKYNRELESKKLKEKELCDEKDSERKKSVHVRLFEDGNNRSGRQSEPQGSKFFRTIMKRRFGTPGVGYTFSSLLDSASFRDIGKTTAGSTSGYTETFLTCSESVMDLNTSTCVESVVESSCSRTSKRVTSLSRSESPERPRTSLSQYSFKNVEVNSRKHKAKSISQSSKSDPKKNPKLSSKTEAEGELSGKKQKSTSEDDEVVRIVLEDEQSTDSEKKLRLRPAKYLYHMCNCHQVARPSTMKKLTKISRKKIAGVIEIYGCRGSADNAEDGASSGIGTSSLSSGMSGESGGGVNVVCPFCMIPKERVNAWMEDINDINASAADQPGIRVPPRSIFKGHTPVTAQDGTFCDEVF